MDLFTWLSRRPVAALEAPILLGAQARLPARLLAVKVPSAVAEQRRRRLRQEARRQGRTPGKRTLALAAWTLLVTNVPVDLLSIEEALVLRRARWQIELLFKLWKSLGRLDESRSAHPWRQLSELYARVAGAARTTLAAGALVLAGSRWQLAPSGWSPSNAMPPRWPSPWDALLVWKS